MTLAFLNIGTQEMMLIVIVILFLFGGKKLPELARGLGRGIREFKDASDGIKREISDQINNFEKDLDVEEPAKSKAATSSPVAATVSEEMRAYEPVKTEEAASPETESIEKKPESNLPKFSAPAGTFQHNPHSATAANPAETASSDNNSETDSKLA